ncbi:MAG: sulfite exporter TauE/SafE family protein [Flavobacteriia bacterium]|nr:sulfite exporter TauE/SafE family protein [Flavobacteriia bacterium]
MGILLVCLVVFIGALLTFFSGFGLGTLMLPVFSLFFPLPVAIGATAVIHFANNIFKFTMVYKGIHWPTILRFGLPAFVAAILGSKVLTYCGDFPPLFSYHLFNKVFDVTYMKTLIGLLMIVFALIEFSRFKERQFPIKYMPLGGFLSGFFGGVSGHQGAFRSAFLAKSGLTKEQFIGTSNSIALVIDLTRLIVYYETINFGIFNENKDILISGTLVAFLGTFLGNKYVKKITLLFIKKIVAVCLLLIGTLFLIGIL